MAILTPIGNASGCSQTRYLEKARLLPSKQQDGLANVGGHTRKYFSFHLSFLICSLAVLCARSGCGRFFGLALELQECVSHFLF